ncbi:MAG TPA: T9SS type A sorting domain-containing protein, partial [Paludibacter sp.]
ASIFINGTDSNYIRSLNKLTVIEQDPTTPADYRNQLNSGPFQLVNGATRTFAFAIIAGDELNDIKYSATRANTVYSTYTALDGVINDYNYGLTLSQNYPNPFKNETRISYSVTNPGIVSLKVIDLQGKEVAVVFNKFVPSGTYSATIKANNIPSGMYIYKLESEGFVVAKRLVVLK